MLVLVFVVFSFSVSGALTDKLISSWTLDIKTTPAGKTYNWTDYVSRNNMTSVGSVLWAPNKYGKNGGAVRVDAASYIKPMAPIAFHKNVSFNLWVNGSAYGAGTYKAVVSTSEVAGSSFDLMWGHDRWRLDDNNGLDCAIYIAPTINKWYMITGTKNSTHGCLYINGTAKVCCARAWDVATATPYFGQRYAASQYWVGQIDEINYWDKKINDSEITRLYNAGAGFFYPFTVPIVEKNHITFIKQQPSDFTELNIISPIPNTTYLVNFTSLNLSRVNIYFQTNLTPSIVNGTKLSIVYKIRPYSSNKSKNFTFNFNDNDIIPAIYNYNETKLELTVHKGVPTSGSNDFVSTTFYAVNSSKQYSFFEVYAKNKSANQNLKFYYCNSSYSTGLIVSSAFCTNFYTIPSSNNFNHTHSAFSKHYVVPFPIVAKKINGIVVSPTSYILVGGSNWNITGINGTARVNTVRLTANGGNTYSNQVMITDAHLHQFTGTEYLRYFAKACNLSNYCLNTSTSLKSDRLDVAKLPPTIPTVKSPIDDYYNGIIRANWTASTIAYGTIVNYNISVYFSNYSFYRWIGTSGTNLNKTFSVSTFANMNLTVGVIAISNESLKSPVGFSMVFGVDTVPPTGYFFFPTYGKVVSQGVVRFNWTLSDANALWSVNVSCSFANNVSYYVENIGLSTYVFDQNEAMANLGFTKCLVVLKDSHTDDSFKAKSIITDLKNNRVAVNGLTIDAGSTVKKITTKELKDKVSYCYEYSGRMEEDNFYLPSYCLPVDYKPEYNGKRYEGHFVCKNDYWVDFEPFKSRI
jgi:hypothetical protein